MIDGSLAVTVFFGGLLGAAHCTGMCGPLVAAQAMGQRGPWWSLRSHLFYHLGRVGTYMVLGGLTGGAGSLFAMTSRVAGLAGLPHLLLGLAMILLGLGAMGWSPMNLERALGGESLANRVVGWSARLGGGGLGLGVVTGLLPCSLHWAFQAQAAASGSVVGGMMVMLAFGLGTALPLGAFGLVAGLLGAANRRRVLWLAGLVVVYMGVRGVRRGLELFGGGLGVY
ncbi:MAG: sulfite exporter TauE/SafE family protein [Magnetococcales bacterium]|nr:sulfite exporter TauE/SafE family protein [Magnetococcales bacterium]